MMGTLATSLAGCRISTTRDRYRAEVEGDIEDVEGILRITRIRVHYYLRLPAECEADARAAFESYLERCPAAMSVRGAIDVQHALELEYE
jgi:organic hydroperoxide reductase OsmC/OhrA